MPRHPHQPNDETRRQVEELSSRGVRQQDIAILVGVSVPVLHREYREELDRGMAVANATVTGRLFALTESNAAAAIFWAKCRLGFQGRQQGELSGPQGGPGQDGAGTGVGALLAPV